MKGEEEDDDEGGAEHGVVKVVMGEALVSHRPCVAIRAAARSVWGGESRAA